MEIITLIGFVAATCTTISFLPQVIKIIKTKHTKDLSLGMYSVLAIGILLWFLYGVMNKDFPIIFANAISFIFVAIILIQIIKNK